VKLRTALMVGACWMLWAAALTASGKDKDKADQMVDSGSFSVVVNGRTIATETFSVQQRPGGSTIKSEMKEASGATQNSELQLTAAGEVVRYEWREQSPGKSELLLVPNDQFLKESITNNPGDKPTEQPFLLPASTAVLDNNFFVHREVLAWRYLGSSCKTEAGKLQCATAPADFGAVIPQDRVSMRVTLELKGKEKLQVHGTQRELMRVNLKSDSGEWAMWLDDQDQFKLVRILIASDNTEIVRD
jgi:hypothetical protein